MPPSPALVPPNSDGDQSMNDLGQRVGGDLESKGEKADGGHEVKFRIWREEKDQYRRSVSAAVSLRVRQQPGWGSRQLQSPPSRLRPGPFPRTTDS